MGKIKNYPNDTTISGADKLIGTDADDSNATKNFTIAALAAYFQAAGNAINLQAVTDVGNETLDTIIAAGFETDGDVDAQGQVIAGSGVLTNFVELDTSPGGVSALGRITWGTNFPQAGLSNTVAGLLGQNNYLYVHNDSGGTLTATDYSTVFIKGVNSGSPSVGLASTDDPDERYCIGVASAQNITNGSFGFIVTQGLVTGINASGSLQGETWANGDVLHLSDQQGVISNDATFGYPIGVVVSNNASTGIIYINPTATAFGPVNATTGVFSGAVTVASLASAGAVSGTTGTFSGAIAGTTANLTAITANSLTASGVVAGANGSFSSGVSAVTGTFSGAVSVAAFTASGLPKLSGLSTYANNAAALVGGLVANDVYKTATGELRIVV